MRLTTKITLIVVGVTLLTCAVSAYFSYSSHLRLAEEDETREMQALATSIQNDIQAQADKAAARASLVCSLPSVQEAFRAGDREQLARLLVPAFLIQRDKFGVIDVHFHLPPATSFLRLYDLKTYGEDLSSYREMILTTNRRQEPQKGIEIGRRGLGIRGIDLLKDAQGPIGSMEVGMSFAPVTNNIKNVSGFEAGVFVDDQLMTTNATSSPRPDADHIIGGFRNVEATNWQTVRKLVSGDLLSAVHDVTLRRQRIDGVDYGVVALPMLDFKGKQIGVIVAVGSFEATRRRLLSAFTGIVSAAVFQAVVLIGMTLIILRAMFLRPMAGLREALAQMADGRRPELSAEALRRRDEIGETARQVSRLQDRLTAASPVSVATTDASQPRA